MKLNKPKNPNYCATVVEIKTIIPLKGCDFVQAAIIFGNQVVVDKSIKEGDVGLYFPVECQLSKEYLSVNNLYRKSELNVDKDKKGYFEENGRIRCVKFRGHKSEGLFMPIESVDEFTVGNLQIGDEFDELNGVEICRKYIVKQNNPQYKIKSDKKKAKVSKIVDGQFRFHEDTEMLYKNLNKINPDDLISITYKLHGTSGISSKVLCKRKLSLLERILKTLGVNISDKQYDYINSSRKVVKNDDLNENPGGFYNEDIWSLADQKLRDFLQDGITLYYEIVGYLPSGAYIQKDYDYGENGTFGIYIYRITYTNQSGKVFEFSAKQVQDWCKQNGLKAVPQLYYGRAESLACIMFDSLDEWRSNFLENIKKQYNEKDCFMCNNKVPEEGVVIRIEKNEFEAYKCKSTRFYERETSLLDKGEQDIETQE